MSSAPPTTKPTSSHGVIVVGLDRAELVAQVLGEHATAPNGYAAPIYLVDPDTSRVDALLRSGIIDPSSSQVRVFTGANCVQSLLAQLRDQLEIQIPRQIVGSGEHAAPHARQIASGINALAETQTADLRRSYEAIQSRWAERGLPYWSARYKAIANGDPARVLVVTTRYSTFIQYACRDLADAFGSLGHESLLVLEPDPHSILTPLRCTRAIESFDPDLIVVTNYPRILHAKYFPQGVPHVCWIQDAMAHLFKPLPEPPTPLDFIAGHLYPDAMALSGFPDEARLEFPVPISGTKFHDAPVPHELAKKYACDIAYVSHQSEPAQLLHARFIDRLPAEKRDQIEGIYESAKSIVGQWPHLCQKREITALKRELATCFGSPEDLDLLNLLWTQYLQPLIERLLRHQTLGWAAEIAQKHDLTLRLFGNGWEQHPTLNRYAAGPIPHDDHLRACYQTAKVQLHASTSGSSHQRVFECAMSGGLVLSLRSWDEFYHQDWYRMSLFLDKQLPHDVSLVRWKQPAYLINNHAELKSIIDDRERMPFHAADWYHRLFDGAYARIRSDDFFQYWDAPVPPEQMRAIEILGDPFDTTFSTPEELEEKTLRAISDPDWRRVQSSDIAKRARERISMSRFAETLLKRVGDRLATSTITQLQEAGA